MAPAEEFSVTVPPVPPTTADSRSVQATLPVPLFQFMFSGSTDQVPDPPWAPAVPESGSQSNADENCGVLNSPKLATAAHRRHRLNRRDGSLQMDIQTLSAMEMEFAPCTLNSALTPASSET